MPSAPGSRPTTASGRSFSGSPDYRAKKALCCVLRDIVILGKMSVQHSRTGDSNHSARAWDWGMVPCRNCRPLGECKCLQGIVFMVALHRRDRPGAYRVGAIGTRNQLKDCNARTPLSATVRPQGAPTASAREVTTGTMPGGGGRGQVGVPPAAVAGHHQQRSEQTEPGVGQSGAHAGAQAEADPLAVGDHPRRACTPSRDLAVNLHDALAGARRAAAGKPAGRFRRC